MVFGRTMKLKPSVVMIPASLRRTTQEIMKTILFYPSVVMIPASLRRTDKGREFHRSLILQS